MHAWFFLQLKLKGFLFYIRIMERNLKECHFNKISCAGVTGILIYLSGEVENLKRLKSLKLKSQINLLKGLQ